MAWVSDGSSEIAISGDTVTCSADGRSDNQFNALWSENGEGVNSGEHYWKVTLQNLSGGGAFVGLTNQSRFKKGYGIKGLLYGGNLSNGSALLVSNYGPRFKDGDTVGILASFKDNKLKIYYDLNGSSLGLAFDVTASVLPDARPVVAFSQAGSAKITRETDVPSDLMRVAKKYTGFEGSWKTIPQGITLDGVPFQGDLSPTLSLKATQPSTFKFVLRVINTISASVETSASGWKSDGPAMSTLMAGPPEDMELEKTLSGLVLNPDSVVVTDVQLTIKKNKSEAIFNRFDETPKLYSDNPFV